MKTDTKSLVIDTHSKLYALAMVVIGLLLSASKLAPGVATVELTDLLIELFFIFLTGVAILFFLFMFMFLVRRVSHFEESEVQEWDDRVQERREMSRAQSFDSLDTTFTFEVTPPSETNSENMQQVRKQSDDGRVSLPQGRSVSTLDLPTPQRDIGLTRRAVSALESPLDARNHRSGTDGTVAPATILRHGEAAYPNFYVRVGAVFFGIGTLISSGLVIIFNADVAWKCDIAPKMDVFRCTLQALFAALQLQFIFKYSKISINRFKGLCQFGIMHLIATNVNLWIYVVMHEVSEVMKEQAHGGRHTRSASLPQPGLLQPNGYDLLDDIGACNQATKRIDDIVSIALFLYPLIIEFSLIGAVSFNNIYANIGLMEKIRRRRRLSKASSSVPVTVPQFPNNRKFNVTCHKSYKGAFFGIIMATSTVTLCIVHNAYEKTDLEVSGAIFNSADTVLLFFGIIAVCSALYMINNLSILPTYRKGPDENLLMIAVVGVYTFDSFTIYSYVTSYQLEVWMRVAGAFAGCLSLLQATLQVLFVYDGLRRHTVTTKNLRQKPGREAVVLLLLLNLALWLLYLLELRGGVYHVMAYANPHKVHEWNVMATLCKPLSIFFRFHSTTCLYEIWKNSYKRHQSMDDD